MVKYGKSLVLFFVFAVILSFTLTSQLSACDVTQVQLFIGKNQDAVENEHNTDTVYTPKGSTGFWYHVHITANPPHTGNFELKIYDGTTLLDTETVDADNDSVTEYSNTASVLNTTGNHTVKVEVKRIGTSVTSGSERTLIVYDAHLQSITFTSDHQQLTNNDSTWSDAGTSYSKPEWLAGTGTDTPISQTKNTSLSINVAIKVEPSGIAFNLVGDGPDNYVDFTTNGNTSTGSDQTISMTAAAALPNQIAVLSKSISWKVVLTGPDPDDEESIGNSGAHTIYVTWGTPADNGVCTKKRMAWVCQKGNGDSSLQSLAEHIQIGVRDGTKFGMSDPTDQWLGLNYTPEYSLDCLQGSALVVRALMLLGVPVNDLSVQVSYASHDTTGDSDYPSDVTDQETTDTGLLEYTTNATNFYQYEGSFKVNISGIWNYYTVFDPSGPFTGTGADNIEKDKSARYQILDFIRDNVPTFVQKYGRQGTPVSLP